ncbi:Nonsense-mediated mRNA decay factor [Madurella fahalii]|uniref:Nonsense-mediated mRNA decay factor n=1 Tax=Madurella fahalii TaxID=1157608 RepID=A0ABQ0GR29_9PEZI
MASTAGTAATAKAPLAIPPTDETWKAAQKLRVAVYKELEHIQNGGPSTNEVARFEKVEKLMENYRLACIETIWPDIRAAKERSVEDALWQTHTQVTKTYRKVLARLQGHEHAVLRRKLERLYSAYLKTAQYFYKGYLQRVCARYDMEDLKRIARQAELDEIPVPDADKVDAAAAKLEEIVRDSCHKTLIYLGDLARYRTLLRPKDRKWEGALAYYFLANDLIPESGYGHHQCGVIYVEAEDHLQVVYHFYRAMVCDMPHPNAPANLEREFRDLQKRKGGEIKHALATWFVKLHAFYYQGKEFAERKELESEVDHRLALAMKSGTGLGSETDLLKIILVNITAYAISQEKIRAKWTEEGSRSCQFILLLNIRTIHTISRLLGDEVADLIQRKTAESPASAQKEVETSFTPTFTRILPLLRVYMAWLCAYGSELVDFRTHLEPQFGAMCLTLSNTLTLLLEFLGAGKFGSTVSWRFPEDEMTLGIKCLNGPDLHDGCQLYYDAFTRQPKPRREDVPVAEHTADDVTFTRSLDVVLCAVDLSAPESKFPFTTSTVTKGPREHTAIVYLEGGKPDPTQRLQAAQPVAATPSAIPAGLEQQHRKMPAPPSLCESNELSEDREFYGPSLGQARSRARRVQAAPAAPVSEFPMETHLFRVLNDFLVPPESAPTRKPETPTRPLAHPAATATGEDPGAATSTSPGPGSAGMKAIPTLPWNYFYTPAPVDSALQRSSMSGAAPGWSADGPGSSRPASSGSRAQLRAGPSAGNLLSSQAHSRHGSPGRTMPLEDQTEALRSLALRGQLNDSTNLHAYGTRGVWPGIDEGSANSGMASNTLRYNPWGPSAADPWQTGQSQQSSAFGRVPNSSFSTLQFSENGSSLPPVNSPLGMPPRGLQRFASQGVPSSMAAAAAHSPSSPNHLRAVYGADPTIAALYAQQETLLSTTSPWSDTARMPRASAAAQPIQRPAPGASDKVEGKKPMMQGMPKR